MNREELEDLRAECSNVLAAAMHSLGKALLLKNSDVTEARRSLAAAKQQLEDIEAMLLALEEMEEPARLWEEEIAWKNLPRVARAEYQAAKKRFESDYVKLKSTPALLSRGKELASLAKTCGEKETNECKAFLRNFDSPELHGLL